MILFYDMKSNLYVFILRCVSITRIEHYMEGVIRQQKTKQAENEKKKQHHLKNCMVPRTVLSKGNFPLFFF